MNALKNVFSKLKSGLKIKGGGNVILSNMNSVLYNKFVLYFILVLSLANLFFLVSHKHYMFASIFVLIGFITSFFSKNMMVILCVAIAVTNVLKYGSKASVEGMENDDKEKDTFVDSNEKDIKPVKSSKEVQPTDDKQTEEKMTKKQEDILKQYKELLELQEKITENIQGINDPLTKAEGLVNSMKESLMNMK